MSAEAALQTFVQGGRVSLTKDQKIMLEADLMESRKHYQKLLLALEEAKRKRYHQNRAIRAQREKLKELEGEMGYMKRKLGKKDE